jgi:hypothetical protein
MARQVGIKLERWMTVRDRQVIVSVYKHLILNSKQVEEIHFKGYNNSRIIALRRLKKLVDNRFLKLHWYGYNKRGTMQHFTITNRGAMIISSELDIDLIDIKVNDAGIISNIEHSSLIADFHINLLNNDFEVKNFTSDKHNLSEFKYMGKEYKLEPDGKGIAVSLITNKNYPFYLEMDRGTMSYEYFKLKIPKYELFYASGKYKEEFNSFPLVIIVTTDDIRMKRMEQIIAKTKQTDITYLITTIEKSKSPRENTFSHIGTGKKIGLK